MRRLRKVSKLILCWNTYTKAKINIRRGFHMTDRKKVKILINMPNPHKDHGGVSNHFQGLSRYFPQNQIDYCYTGGLRNHNKLIALPIYIFQYMKFFYKLFTFNPDIINLNPSLVYDAVIRDGIYLIISRIFRKKVIVFWHGWKDDFQDSIEKKHLRLFKKVYNRADAFIILSSVVKIKLKQWEFAQPIYLTTTKVDNFLVKDFVISEKKMNNNILFLGRLEKTKGVFETLRAFQILLNKNKQVTLTFAGSGPEEMVLKEIVQNEGIKNVSFLGFVRNDEKIKAFTRSDIFILPSYTEGIPTSLLEAMAFGIPIITRPVGGIPDFFVEDSMGYLIESKNPNDFAEKIDRLYSNRNKWEEISQYNHHYALENFMASEIAENMMLIYCETQSATDYKNAH